MVSELLPWKSRLRIEFDGSNPQERKIRS